MKKRLSPLKKPNNYAEFATNDNTMIACLSELIQLQRKTISLLQNNVIAVNGKEGLQSNIKKFSQNMFDNVKMHRDKPQVSIYGQMQREQQLAFPSQQDHTVDMISNSDKILKQALTSKMPNIENKKYNVLNDFIPYTDRREYKILISFESFAKEIPLISGVEVLEVITIEWIGDVFRMVASMCWNMMLNGFLNYEETKILFTENIIYNYIEFMKALEVRGFSQYKHKLTSVINKKSVSILDFLGKQYPQTKIDAPNIRLREILPNTNNSTRMKFDVITIANRKGFEIKYRQNANYAVDVMSLINFIIDQINQSYPDYEKDCLQIFEQIFKLPEKRIKAEDSVKQSRNKLAQIILDSTEDIIYKEKVKKYTKFLIGRKVNKNVPKYSRQEINNGVFYPKSPSILRIITKWVEELTDLIKNPAEFILSADRQLKSHDGNYVILFSRVRKGICDKIIEKRDELFRKVEAIREECFLIQSILSSTQFTSDSTQSHLSDEQISVGKFSVSVQKAISSYIFQQLNQVLHFLLKIPFEVDVTKLGLQQDFQQSEVRRQLDRLNLVTMKVFDLLRCKCISNEEEIIWIMNYLIDRNLIDQFKLVRVKDRLNLGTRDINCNLRFRKNGFLSQMQLSVVSNINIETKQEKLDSYNHFLYQLKRSRLGPLSQNVSIWTVLQQRSLYFQSVKKNPIPQKIDFHACSNESLEKFIRPIYCQSCKNFYPYPEIIYSNIRCKKCKKTYCGECYSKVLSDDDKKTIIFQELFKFNVLSHIKQHTNPDQPFPIEGIYFKRDHERREMNFFTVLMQSAQTQEFIRLQTLKKSDKKQVECTIIFTHTVIRNGKTVQKQKNPDQIIRGTIRNQNQLYINKKDYGFFKKYLIFYPDSKFKPTLMTLDEIEDFLKIQQNHGLKVLNIMEDPIYVDEIQYLRKKSQKLRELDRLKNMFTNTPNQKFLTYHFGKIFIVAKAYKDSLELGNSINYANNIAELKSQAYAEKSIISMEKRKLKDEFNNIDIEMNPKIAQIFYKSLRKLYLNYNCLESIEGLKPFVFLEVLYLRNNNLTSLKGVQEMKELLVFRVDDNKITDLQPLRGLVALKRFMAIENQVQSLEPLRKLINLRTIELQNNLIESLEPIKDLPELEELNFKSNKKITVLPIFASKILRSLAFSNTSISDLSSLSNYTETKRLMLKGLGLKEIPAVIKTMKLEELWLGDNEIQYLTNLQEQSELQIMSLKRNKLKSLKGIEHLTQIKILYLDNNQVKSLEGLKNCFDTLKHLSFKSNPLEDLNLIMYADESIKLEYTKEILNEMALKFLDQLYLSKVNSSGSED